MTTRGKYGRLPKRGDNRNLMFAKYTAAAPPAPSSVRYFDAVSAWSMAGNDKAGDCVFAMINHIITLLRTIGNKNATPITDAETIAAYAAFTGYNPATGAGDNGTDELSAIKAWIANGWFGNQASAFAEIWPSQTDALKTACWLTGGAVPLGVSLTKANEDQFDAGEPFQTTWFPSPIIGSHAVPMVGFDENYLYLVTWARVQPATWEWFLHRAEECYAVVDSEAIEASGVDVAGVDLATMQADVEALRGS